MRYFKALWACIALALVTACGGGGGSAGTIVGGPASGGGSTTTTASPTLVVTLMNSQGAEVSTIGLGGGFSARATLKDAAGAVVTNRLVTFTLNGSAIATINPTTAITNSSGVAEVGISPSSLSALGAATVSASAQVGTTTVAGQKDFAVTASNLSLSAITLGSSNLASGGNTSIAVTALVGGVPSTGVPVNIAFSASCGRINNATGSFGATTDGSGVASAVYTAVNADGTLCSGPVTLTASSAGTSARTATVTVANAVANAITYVSATPAQIFVAGSGAAEQSIVRFKVLAGTTPLPNVEVRFSLQTNPGGVGLNVTGSTASVTATTNASGDVSVPIFAGTIPGPVRVRATLVSDAAVFAESQNLTVASGPPSQRFMSLSVGTFNIEGQNIDGTRTQLTVRLADRQGNAVEDGTIVNFTAEGGQVASSCATARVAGISSCVVDFVSQNPRPANGRVSILAFTEGTKDYVDINGNNRFDAGTDTLIQIGDAFRDDNEDDAFQAGEFLIPRGVTGATCAAAGWPFTARENTCNASLSTTVRQQAVLLYSSTQPVLAVGNINANVTQTDGTTAAVSLPSTTLTTGGVSFFLRSADNPLLPMPAGTSVSADAVDTTNNTLSCAVGLVTGTSVPNISPTTNSPLEDLASIQTHSVTMGPDCRTGDRVNVTIRSPSGVSTIFSFTLP
jgi:hypothetical protein